MEHEYKNQLHIDSVSMTDSGKYYVDFIWPDTNEKVMFKISRADYAKCKRAMDMQGLFPMQAVGKELGLSSAQKVGRR